MLGKADFPHTSLVCNAMIIGCSRREIGFRDFLAFEGQSNVYDWDQHIFLDFQFSRSK